MESQYFHRGELSSVLTLTTLTDQALDPKCVCGDYQEQQTLRVHRKSILLPLGTYLIRS